MNTKKVRLNNEEQHDKLLKELSRIKSKRKIKNEAGLAESLKKKSKLYPFLHELQFLRSNNATYQDLADWLKTKGIDIHYTNIARFLNKYAETQL